jgi:dienelactone hydrolase
MDWDKAKPLLWGAVGGAILLAYVGFTWGGWMTTATAEAAAKEVAANAVADRLGLICAAQFNSDSQRSQKLKEMKARDTWERSRYIEKQSWAVMPGDEKPESGVADACAKHLATKNA